LKNVSIFKKIKIKKGCKKTSFNFLLF